MIDEFINSAKTTCSQVIEGFWGLVRDAVGGLIDGLRTKIATLAEAHPVLGLAVTIPVVFIGLYFLPTIVSMVGKVAGSMARKLGLAVRRVVSVSIGTVMKFLRTLKKG